VTPPGISQSLRENERITDPNDPDARLAAEYCENLLRILFLLGSVRPNATRRMEPDSHLLVHDFDRHPVQVVFSDNLTPAASAIPDSNPPAIVLNKGLFVDRTVYAGGKKTLPPLVQNVQDLSVVFAEQMLARKFHRSHGHLPYSSGDTANSSTWRAIERMFFHLGRDPREIDGFLGRRRDHFPKDDSISAALEVVRLTHAAGELKVSGNLDALPELKDDPSTSELPKELLPFLTSQTHKSAFQRHRDQRPQLDKASAAEKVAGILDFLQSDPTPIAARYRDVSKYVDSIIAEVTEKAPPELRRAISTLADFLIDHALSLPEELSEASTVYRKLGSIERRNGEGRPLGRLAKIGKAVTEWTEAVESWDPEEEEPNLIEDAAQVIFDTLPREPAFHSPRGRRFLQQLSWTTMELPAEVTQDQPKQNPPVPWANLYRVIDESGHADAILFTALALGHGADPAILEHLNERLDLVPAVFELWVDAATTGKGSARICQISNGPNRKGVNLDKLLIVDGTIKVKGLDPNDSTAAWQQRSELNKRCVASYATRKLTDKIDPTSGSVSQAELQAICVYSLEWIGMKPSWAAARISLFLQKRIGTALHRAD
jgi:hypothetical protein